jgi:effector-binding domain-containing protein
MTTPIELRTLPARRLLVKRATCAHDGIGPAFGKAIHSVGECMRKSEAKMASMPMTVYLSWRESDCDMAAGCMVRGYVILTHDCEWLDVPGGRHATARHVGPFDTLHETHTAIRNWCAAGNLTICGPCWESYPVDPGTEPDSAKWQTDVHYPVG